jgi:hypothetical protein
MGYKTYRDWFKEIKWLKDKVILPDNTRVSKLNFQTKDGFDINAFNSFLFKTYNEQYPVNDERRYKK